MLNVRTRLLTSAALAVALVSAGTASAVAAPARPRSRPAISVHVARKHPVQAPKRLQPGWVHVRNTGKRPVLLMDPLASAGVATLVREMNAANSDQGALDFTRDFAVVDLLAPHSDSYLLLKRGVQYWLDADANKYTAADVTTTYVKGAARNAAAPKSTRIGLKRNGALTAPPKTAISKNAAVHVVSKSKELEEVLLAPVGKDVSDKQLNAFLAHPSFQGLFKVDTSFVLQALGVVSPHRAFVTRLHSKAGRHLILGLTLSSKGATMVVGQARLLTLA